LEVDRDVVDHEHHAAGEIEDKEAVGQHVAGFDDGILSGLLLENLNEYEANQEDGDEDEQSDDFAVRPGETRAAPLEGEKKAD
jgi:hypothetical protein